MNHPKRTWFLLAVLALLKLGIHLYANGHYGFHRDELLHLSVGEHLAWGYFEFPPLIAVLGALQRFLFGDSVLAIRIFPALAGVAMLVLVGLMAREMRGKTVSVILAATCVLASFAYWRNHTLFQPVAFNQLFWTLGFYWVLRYINTENKNYLLLLGVTVGLGLLNKYSIIYWGAGLTVGLLFYNRGALFRKKWLWIAGGIALLLFLPNLIWQYQHDFPVRLHAAELQRSQLEATWLARWQFIRSQFTAMNPFGSIIWIAGLLGFLFYKPLKTYRLFGIAYLVTLTLFLITNGKAYYLFGIYPVLFAGGAVTLEKMIPNRFHWIIWLWIGWLLFTGLTRMPYGTPFLPIDEFAAYAGLERNSEGRLEGLTGDYADMFGWEEQVALVDSMYQSLSENEREHCIIWAENYGEAGAIKIIGDRYGLPDPVSRHGSFWLWEPPEKPGEIAISIGNEADAVNFFYEDVTLVKMVRHPYAIDEEHNIPFYLCKKPKITLRSYWENWRERVFE